MSLLIAVTTAIVASWGWSADSEPPDLFGDVFVVLPMIQP